MSGSYDSVMMSCLLFRFVLSDKNFDEDEELMLKISQKMGGLPSELQPVLKKCPAFFRW